MSEKDAEKETNKAILEIFYRIQIRNAENFGDIDAGRDLAKNIAKLIERGELDGILQAYLVGSLKRFANGRDEGKAFAPGSAKDREEYERQLREGEPVCEALFRVHMKNRNLGIGAAAEHARKRLLKQGIDFTPDQIIYRYRKTVELGQSLDFFPKGKKRKKRKK